MRDFTQLVSKTSGLYIYLICLFGPWILFQPSWNELLLLLVVDAFAVMPVAVFDKKIFLRLFPDSSRFFPKVDPKTLDGLSTDEKGLLFASLRRFPRRRSLYILVVSSVKVLPAAAVVVFAWNHGESQWAMFFKWVPFQLSVISYYFCVSYVELHRSVSDFIAECHARADWSDVFRRGSEEDVDDGFLFHENVGLMTVAALCFALVVSLLFADAEKRVAEVAFEVLGALTLGTLLLGRVYYLNRYTFVNGLKEIFDTFGTIDWKGPKKLIPVHSSSLLGRFDRTFNSLSDRLASAEKEITRWVYTESERSRYRTLGEVAGLVAHDLASPLHVVRFGFDSLRENPKEAEDEVLMSEVERNLARATDLVTSLRAYLKNSPESGHGSHWKEAHDYVVQLISTQFRHRGFRAETWFKIDPSVEELRVGLSRIDLIHVLDNLYRNSIANQLDHAVEDGQVGVRAMTYGGIDPVVEFEIEDRGTGLSPARFEELTGAVSDTPGQESSALGLRLTRRLVERAGGVLRVEVPAEGRGTLFRLRLPLAEWKPGLVRNQEGARDVIHFA